MNRASPTHHPVAALLHAAAGGHLSPAVSRIVHAHAKLCPRCAHAMADAEAVGGAAMEVEGGASMSADALERALATIAADQAEPVLQLPEPLAALPHEIVEFVVPTAGKAAWRFAGPGLRTMDLALPESAAGETFQVLRIEPGYGPPSHTHGGQEFTLVLTGAFKDETGLYKRGDIAIGDETVTHQPIAEPGEVCFALAVTTAPLKFKGPLGILQRVLNLGRQ
mgnify:CR=1 FL=1